MHQTTVTIYYNFPDVDLRSRFDRSQGSAAENACVKMMMMSPGNVVFRKSSSRQHLEKKIIRSTSAMDSEAVRLASIKNEREDRQEYETSEQRTVYPGLLLDVSRLQTKKAVSFFKAFLRDSYPLSFFLGIPIFLRPF